MVNIKMTEYGGWKNCVGMDNGIIHLIVTTDIGPRIIFFGLLGGENEMCNIPETLGSTGDSQWNNYGGHRLWHSPEAMPRTYIPDNTSVKFELTQCGVKLFPETEDDTHIQKYMEICMDAGAPSVKIKHGLKNNGLWPVELAPWAITVMAPGGIEVIPQPQRDTGYLGNRSIALWPYSKMNDPRVVWGDRYILLKQDPNMKPPFKLGINNEDGWACYFNHGNLYIKKYTHVDQAAYPDFGASYETYTTDYMVEMETLSPTVKLQPGESCTHDETWELHGRVAYPGDCEDQLERTISKFI